MPVSWYDMRGFVLVGVSAALGGAAWDAAGLPLGWLMGAAIVTGCFAVSGLEISQPKPIYRAALVIIGASVGLSIRPAVAAEILNWAPIMLIAALIGMFLAAALAPILSKLGRISKSTAFFSLLPGGIIEMAEIGDRNGADRTMIAGMHAVRVGLVVGILPLALFAVLPVQSSTTTGTHSLSPVALITVLLIALVGGWIGSKGKLPAAWLLGAVLAVGLYSSIGTTSGAIPHPLLAIAQILVGIGLGARFERSKLSGMPRLLSFGTPTLLFTLLMMALVALLVSNFMPYTIETLILCFSIGGMAEMVLTAKALDQNVALVAAFQALRGLTVNMLAGVFWQRLTQFKTFSPNKEG